jgi:radical SAM family uncharacterized protein
LTNAKLNSSKIRSLLETELLPGVSRPGRYIGSELNVTRKNHAEVDVTVALAFPDVYEIGMSNQGIQILYEIINRLEWAAAERVFAPWVDMEQKMREKGVPLYSLETFTPVSGFDILGFSLAYELCYTNVLNMLDLSGIPLRFEERCREGGPLVIAGGLGAFVPEPMWEFIDLFVVGDGEEAIVELLDEFRQGNFRERLRCDPLSRIEFLRSAAKKHEGMYVPHFYRVEYGHDGKLVRIEPVEKGIPRVIRKRTVRNLAEAAYPRKPIVPLVDVVHDRAVVEIMRGCKRGCRFCQAGRLYRPVRELPLPEVVERAKRAVEATGYEEVTLSSLSTGDHSEIEEIAACLSRSFAENRTAISLPSLRPDTFSIELLERVASSKKTGITLAVEAATSRLRTVINKDVEEGDVLAAAEAAYAHGWNLIKVYFMIGLPTERDEDIVALVQLVHKIADVRRGVDGRRGHVNVSIACFVPKAHTPFQWEKLENILELKRKILYIKRLIRGRNIKLKFHDPEKSYLEAVFSRGDRRLSSVIHRAWSKGCRLDDWSEHFRFIRWLDAFRESNTDADFYSYRERPYDEVLPWDHISCGIHKESLVKERERAIGTADGLPGYKDAAGEHKTKTGP